MPTEPQLRDKMGASHVVKVTGMSEELLSLLDARVKQQRATGRAEYIRELIRRDALASSFAPTVRAKRHKARRGRETVTEKRLLEEYHVLVDRELAGLLSPSEQERLRVVEQALDQAESNAPETQTMLARLDETATKLDALLAAVQALPKAGA